MAIYVPKQLQSQLDLEGNQYCKYTIGLLEHLSDFMYIVPQIT